MVPSQTRNTKRSSSGGIPQRKRGPLEVVTWQRRADVIRQPPLPCLSSYHTINLTAGCPNECIYCYAQSYAHHPGWGKVAFYGNLLERLRAEFPRLRKKPKMVYFSTACEPFLAVEEILDHLFEIMKYVLDAGVPILISTKGVVPDRFVELFADYPGRVHVQVGVTTADDSVRAVLEPCAATVRERLDNLRRLGRAGVRAEPRMDPIVPGLTDTVDSLSEVFEELEKAGVREGTASYLFLRYGIKAPKGLAHGDWSFQEMRRLYTDRVTEYCGKGTIYLPPASYRREHFNLIQDLAQGCGIRIRLCRCKNPGLTEECCHPVVEEGVFGG